MATIVIAVAVHLRRQWVPLGDHALTVMWTSAVGGRGTPLVGGDSRFGWDHLGPWLFYLLAVPYRLLGGSVKGILLGAGLINTACLILLRRIVRSVAGATAAGVVTIGAMLSLLTAGGARLVDPWNPHVVLLPFLVAVVACWTVCCGVSRWLPWMIATGSLCIQAHIAFLPPVVVLFAAATFATVRRSGRPTARVLSVSAVVAVVAWLPTIIDLVRPGGHNLVRVARFFVSTPAQPVAGWPTGVRVVLRETGLRSSWLGGHPNLTVFAGAFDGGVGWAPGAGLLALATAACIAARRHNKVVGRLVVLVAALLGVAVVEMSQIRGPVYPYLFGWVAIVAMLACCSLLLVVLGRAASPIVDAAGRVVAVALVACILVTSFREDLPRSPLERVGDSTIVERLVRDAGPGLDRGAHYRLLHGADQFNSIYEHGVADELLRAGFHLRVSPQLGFLFGPHLVDPGADSLPSIEIVAPYRGPTTGPGVLAVNDPLTEPERREEIRLTAELVNAYAAADSPVAVDIVQHVEDADVLLAEFATSDTAHHQEVQRLATLRARGRPVAVLLDAPELSTHQSLDFCSVPLCRCAPGMRRVDNARHR